MRKVTMSIALALSFVAFSLSAPASAAPEAKEQATKQSTLARVPSAKKATKKATVAKQARKRAVVAKQRNAPPAIATKPAKKKVHRVRVASNESTSTESRFRFPTLFASSDIVSEARRWIGTNPTSRDSLWCARFMNFVLERAGFKGTGSDAAKSFASYGRRVSGPQVGAIAVMTRGKNGGHVGVVSGIDSSGNPIIISGNHNKRVGEGTYSRARIYAYVMPI